MSNAHCSPLSYCSDLRIKANTALIVFIYCQLKIVGFIILSALNDNIIDFKLCFKKWTTKKQTTKK